MLSYAIYEHSKLPLRVFEAARIATAMIKWLSDMHELAN